MGRPAASVRYDGMNEVSRAVIRGPLQSPGPDQGIDRVRLEQIKASISADAGLPMPAIAVDSVGWVAPDDSGVVFGRFSFVRLHPQPPGQRCFDRIFSARSGYDRR